MRRYKDGQDGEQEPVYTVEEYLERQDAYVRRTLGPPRARCPNPHCENGVIRGTVGVGCAVCNGGADAR
jgi:hypothetical protein